MQQPDGAVTLSAVASDPSAVNYAQARMYVASLGHQLELLKVFLELLGGPCLRAVVRRQERLAPLRRDDPLTLTPARGLIWTALHRPRELYAWNDAVLHTIAQRDYLPGASPLVIAELRFWNALLWRCAHAPDTCAVLIFWWLSTAYAGLYMLMDSTQPVDTFWADGNNLHLLERYITEMITDIANHDCVHALHSTLLMHATLHYCDCYHDIEPLRSDSAPHSQQLACDIKPLIVAEVVRACRTDNPASTTQAPPPSQSLQ